MAERLKDKVALVIGAGSIGPGWGLGKATSVEFAREGAKVFAVDINGEAAGETRFEIEKEGGTCIAHQADAAQPDEVEALVAKCLDSFGRIDVLHNNVGIMPLGGPVELDVEDWTRATDVNMKSHYLACKHVLPHMERQGAGAIVNISSIAGIRWTGVAYAAYSATKAATVGFTKSIALQYAAKGIRANCILPGLMDTPMMHAGLAANYGGGDTDALREKRRAQCPMGRLGTAWDVAKAAAFLASDDAAYITGAELVVDGGVTVTCVG